MIGSLRTIELRTARRLAVSRQRLAGRAPASSPARVMDVVRDIRCIQLDPISVVARNPHLVLHARLADYRPEHLDRPLWRDRSLFEYWAHGASIVLTEDYAIHRYRMRTRHREDTASGRETRSWLRTNAGLRRWVLAELRRRGPLPLRDLPDRSHRPEPSVGWPNERAVAQMMRILWTEGRVMVAGRDGHERLWDLTERLIPDAILRRSLTDLQVTRRAAELSVRGLGVGTARHIREHFTIGRYPQLPRVLEELVRRGRLIPIKVVEDGHALPERWYLHRDDVSVLDALEEGAWAPRASLLSPFDNLIHDRRRLRELFGIDYRIEIYTPKERRRWGYYVMPVLYGDRFVGRIDPAVDRGRRRLVIHAVHAEPDVTPTVAAGRALAGALEGLALLVDADAVEIRGALPAPWRRPLRALS